MKLSLAFLLCSIVVRQSGAQDKNHALNRYNQHVLFIGIENPIILPDTLDWVFIRSDRAEIRKENSVFFVSPVDHSDSIPLDIYSVFNIDTVKVRTEYFYLKQMPYPEFAINGIKIGEVISRSALLKQGRFDVQCGDSWLDRYLHFKLESFDLEIEGKKFHSNSEMLTKSMIFWISNSPSKQIKISNDLVSCSGERRFVYKEKIFRLEE